MDISDRIKERLQTLKLKGVDIVKATGISSGGVSQWMTGLTKPTGNNLFALAKLLEVDPEWLQYGKESLSPYINIKGADGGLRKKNQYPLMDLSNAGLPLSDLVETLRNAKYYPCPEKCGYDTFIIKIKGVSMSPVFSNGDLVFIDPDVEAENGKYVLVRFNGEKEAVFRKLFVEGGRKFLTPENPSWPEQLTPVSDNCRIIGTAIFTGKSL